MPKDPDIRWRQRFQSFRKAFTQLNGAGDLEQQGLIQAFEFTHELAWNTLKDFLESRGATRIYGSKDATREAFSRGLIANGLWNRSSHTYNEKTAKELADAILSSFVAEFETLRATFTDLEKREP